MAVNSIANAYVKIIPSLDAGAIKTELGKAVAGTGSMGKQIGNNLKNGMASPLKSIGRLITGAFSVYAITNFTSQTIKAAESDEKANAILTQHIKTMGLFGNEAQNVSTRLQDYAGKLAVKNGVEDDAIKTGQGLLMTFSEVGKSANTTGGVFDRATQAAIDLAASGFGTVDSASIQLGKALQDPTNKLTALQKSGITFTAAEKTKIKVLQESGDMLGAQAILLKAIETQVGGTAAASLSSTDQMKVAYGELQESIGNVLLPVFKDVAGYIVNNIIPAVQSFIEEFKKGNTPLNDFLDVVKNIFNYLKDNWSWISAFGIALLGVVGAIKLIVGVYNLWKAATVAFTIVQGIFNAVMALNPIYLIVIAVAALIAGIIYLATQTTFFQDLWSAMVAGITAGWEAFVGFFQVAIESIGGFFNAVFTGIGDAFKGYVNFWIGLVEGFVNFFIDGINMILKGFNSIKFTAPDWVPFIGGNSFGVNIPLVSKISLPRLAEGGLVMPQPGGVVANIAEAGKPEVVYPLDRFEAMMGLNNKNAGQITVNNYAPVGMSSEEQLTRAIERSRTQAGW